jgi:hypothetical protein
MASTSRSLSVLCALVAMLHLTVADEDTRIAFLGDHGFSTNAASAVGESDMRGTFRGGVRTWEPEHVQQTSG